MKAKQNTFDFLLSQTHDKSFQNLIGQLSPSLRSDHLSGYLPVVLSQGMAISRNDGHKLLLGRFCLGTRGNLFTRRTAAIGIISPEKRWILQFWTSLRVSQTAY